MNLEFPNQAANKIRELQKLAERFNVADLEARVKKLEGELMALKARLGKHG